MKVVIIEDEKPASDRLQKLLKNCDPSIEVISVISDVRTGIEFLRENTAVDLMFMDIRLTDGHSFDIFDETDIKCPVIFITAFDEFWQKAFEYNGIDYLMKPVREEKLVLALHKYAKMKTYFHEQLSTLKTLNNNPAAAGYKSRFLVKRGIEYKAIRTDSIAYFFASHKVVCLVERSGQKYILDESLNEIEKDVDPAQFYRVNRKYLVHIEAIKKIASFPKSKLMLELQPDVTEEVIVPQESVAEFKNWISK